MPSKVFSNAAGCEACEYGAKPWRCPNGEMACTSGSDDDNAGLPPMTNADRALLLIIWALGLALSFSMLAWLWGMFGPLIVNAIRGLL